MHVSYAELNRIAPEVIRMVGVPFGHADDAVECFVWTECVLQRGYVLAQMAEERRAGAWPKPELRSLGRELNVRLDGVPLLLYAGRLCDLAVAEVFGDARVDCINAAGGFGGWVAPYMAHRLARGGHAAVVAWTSAEPRECPNALAFACGDELWLAPIAAFEAIQVPVMPGGMEGPRAGELRILALPTGLSPHVAIERSCTQFGLAAESSGRVDPAARLQAAISQGMERDADQHRAIVKMAARIRAPASERSRAQAG